MAAQATSCGLLQEICNRSAEKGRTEGRRPDDSHVVLQLNGATCGLSASPLIHQNAYTYAEHDITRQLTIISLLMVWRLFRRKKFNFACNVLCVAVSCDVQLIKNINVAAGLVNSATGTVVTVMYDNDDCSDLLTSTLQQVW